MLGKLTSIRTWYDRVKQRGPAYGYFLNDKTKLIVKAPFLNKAKELFADEKIEISAEGARDLGAAIGSAHFLHSQVDFCGTEPAYIPYCGLAHLSVSVSVSVSVSASVSLTHLVDRMCRCRRQR